MNCHVCGTPLPAGAAFCPRCGTNFSSSGSQAHDPTARASYAMPPPASPPSSPSSPSSPSPSSPPVQFPHTGYGSAHYEVPPSTGYSTGPYNAPSLSGVHGSDLYTPLPRTPPVTPVPQLQNRKSPLVISLVILAVAVVLGGSLFAFASFINVNKAQQQASATATAVANRTATVVAATQNPYPPKTGALVISDPMRDNSRGYKWDEATMRGNTPEQGNAICGFQNNAYHIEREKKGALICNPEASTLTFKNLALEAKLTILQGSGTGLVVRFDQAKATGYLFEIFTNGDYNLYKIYFNETETGKIYQSIRSGSNAAIKRGQNQANLVAIVANNETISAYVNGTFIDQVQDRSFTEGIIGLFGEGEGVVDVVVSDVRAWQLS